MIEKNTTFSYKIITLGCPVNQQESAALEAALRQEGFQNTDHQADIYVINSCAVTGAAARKSRKEARRAKKENPGALVVFTGCYSQVEPEEIKQLVPEADIIVGTVGRSHLPQLISDTLQAPTRKKQLLVRKHRPDEAFEIEKFEPHFSRLRPVIKIQEGCNETCTYCIVRYARGRSRSKPPEQVEEEVTRLAAAGYREIILAGTQLGAYASGQNQRNNLPDLLYRLAAIKYHFRIRLSYLEPMGVNEELLKAIASNPRICNHLYLPLQSGSNHILNKMGRRYTVEEFSSLVGQARNLMPDISVTTDIIVGFPGETKDDHLQSLETIRRLQFSKLHVFPYSPRPHTRAARFPGRVRPDIQKLRVKEMNALGKSLATIFHHKSLNQKIQVLIEKLYDRDGVTWGEGLSENYILTRFPLKEQMSIGELVTVKSLKAFSWGIEGTLI